jgi:[acyl-carrier-protein] S-malonyltransferase
MGQPWRESSAWSLVRPLSEWSGHDIEELLLRTGADAIRRTDLAQIAIFSVSVIALAELRRVVPQLEVCACAGHSLGEYTALVAAGALSTEDGARIVAARGAAMRAAANQRPGLMAAVVGARGDEVEALAAAVRGDSHEVWVANLNTPDQVVVSGAPAGVAVLEALATDRGLRAVRLPVTGAFHSPFMRPALPELGRALAQAAFTADHIRVVANVDARLYGPEGDWRALAARQLTSPVRWHESVVELAREPSLRFVSVGRARALSSMVGRSSPSSEAITVESPADVMRFARDWQFSMS